MKPYVISGELELSGEIGEQELSEFRSGLVADLRGLGKQVEWVDASELRDGLNELIEQSQVPVVTLDTRYVRADLAAGMIAVSRAVGSSLEDAGYDSRIGSQPIMEQLESIGERFAGREIALADDVLFSGRIIAWLAGELARRDVRVVTLLAGVAVGEGTRRLADRQIDVRAVRTYGGVDDEVCERDLALVPGSGRKVIGEMVSALYFDDEYGRPESWASIPAEEARDFCIASLQRSLSLVRPDADISEIGTFLCYPLTGNARQIISDRITRLSQAELAL